ncbi:MAG: ABC transporter permease subunit [Deltaproteobacteria bacterium]|nr:ABC transporter permease subunit [Deltaproteobacteria bacterium]
MRHAVMVAVVVVAVAVVVFALLPLLLLLGVAVGLPGVPHLEALAAVFEHRNLVALRESVVVSAGAVVVAAVVGVPLAVLVERTDVPGARALGALGALPLAIPPYILAFAFRALFDDRIGLVPVPVLWGGDVDSRGGIALVLGIAFLPLVVLRLRAALSVIDGSLEEAARIAGASPLRALLDHTLPLTLPSLLSSLALVFVAAAASWGVPVLLGLAADPPVVVVTARIAVSLQSGSAVDLREALGLSLALALIAGAAFALPAILTRGKNVVVVAGKAARPQTLSLARLRVPIGVLTWFVVIALVVGPLLALVLQGLLKTAGGGVYASNLGLVHVQRVLERADVRHAAFDSLWLAALSAVVVVVASVVVGTALRRSSGRVRRALQAVRGTAEVVYALPGTIVAVALVLAFSQEIRLVVAERLTFALVLGGSTALVLVAYAIKHAALGLRAVDEALGQVHPSLEEAARTSGAHPGQAFVDVTLPLLRAHLVAAAVAIALPCFTELTMSVLLQAPGTQTLGVVLFSLYDYGDPQQAMALSALLVALVLVAQLGLSRLRRKKEP